MIMAQQKTTLGLNMPTDPRWVNIAEKSIEEILIDHAYCEQKAASSGISLIVQYPEYPELVELLTGIVAEEWSHFERVMEMMNKRNIPLGRKRKDEYVIAIGGILKGGGNRETQLVEKLLLNALIEARSCERFKILHENKLGVNLMQNSAINFSICLENEKNRIEKVIPIFQEKYRVLYNTGLELLTIRHYEDSGANDLIKGHEVILEQKTRNTLKFLLRNLDA